MVVKRELKFRSVNTMDPLSFLKNFYNFPFILFPSQAGDCSVFCDHCIWWGKTKGFVYSHETTGSLFVVFAEGARTVKMNLVYGLALHEVSVAQVIRAPARCLGGHRFESCRGHRFFLLPTLVTCWIFHFHICVTSLKIYFLSLFHQKCFARSGKQLK